MRINASKTKEMIIEFSKETSVTPEIQINGAIIERVDCVKLLGIIISSNLKWEEHISAIYAKASSRVYFVCMLRRARVSEADLLQIYAAIIRPILEYACPVWHAGLTKQQEQTLESIQKRVLRIIFPGVPYVDAIQRSGLSSLTIRRNNLCKKPIH